MGGGCRGLHRPGPMGWGNGGEHSKRLGRNSRIGTTFKPGQANKQNKWVGLTKN